MALAQDEKPVGQQPIDFEALGLEPVGEEELFGGKIETAVAEAPEPAPTSTGELDYAALGLEPIAKKEMFGFEMPKKEPQKTSDWDTLRGLEVSMRQVPQLAYGVAGLVGATSEQITGYGEALRDWGFRGYKDWEQSIEPVAKETDDVTVAWQRAKEGDVGALVDWAQYGIGYALGQLGETAAVSALGALAGGAAAAPAGPAAVPAAAGGAVLAAAGKTGFKALATNLVEKAIAKQALKIAEEQATKQGVKLTAEQLAKQAESQAVKKLAGKEIGSNAAIFANSIGMELGGIYGEAESQAKAEGRELTGVDLARIWGTGLAAGGLEGLTDKIGLDLLKGKLSAKLPAGRLAGSAVAGGIGILGEGLTETAQTALERAGAGKDVISDDAVNEYINAASLGALGGGVIGGAGGFISGNPKENAAAKAKISAEVSKTIAPETANEVAKQADAVIQEVAQETPDQRVARLQQEAKAAAGITLEEESTAPTPTTTLQPDIVSPLGKIGDEFSSIISENRKKTEEFINGLEDGDYQVFDDNGEKNGVAKVKTKKSGKKVVEYVTDTGEFIGDAESLIPELNFARFTDATGKEGFSRGSLQKITKEEAAQPPTPEAAPTPEIAQAAQARITEREGQAATPVETPAGTRVEAAAYQAPDGTVYYGASHLDAMAKARDAGKINQAAIDAKQEVASRETPEFGFATDKEAFIGRSQAEVVATGSGQMLVDKPATGLLHSNEVSLDAFQEAAKSAQPVIPTAEAPVTSTVAPVEPVVPAKVTLPPSIEEVAPEERENIVALPPAETLPETPTPSGQRWDTTPPSATLPKELENRNDIVNKLPELTTREAMWLDLSLHEVSNNLAEKSRTRKNWVDDLKENSRRKQPLLESLQTGERMTPEQAQEALEVIRESKQIHSDYATGKYRGSTARGNQQWHNAWLNKYNEIEAELISNYPELAAPEASPTPEVREARREPAVTPQQDRDYLDAVERGDSGNDNLSVLLRASKAEDRSSVYQQWAERNPKSEAKLQNAIRSLAKSKGYDIAGFHGSGGPILNDAFDLAMRGKNTGSPSSLLGFFFASSKNLSDWYATTATGQQQFQDSVAAQQQASEKMESISRQMSEIINNAKPLSGISENVANAARKMAWSLDKDTRTLIDNVFGKIESLQELRNQYDSIANDPVMSLPQQIVYASLQQPSQLSEILENRGITGEYLLKFENPEIVDHGGQRMGRSYSEIINKAIEDGKDGVIIRNTEDPLPSDIYIALKPEQIKSASAVTFDKAGNIIPLSQRFQPEQADIRYRRRVQMGRAGMEPSAVEARLQELGFPTGGIIRVVNQPDADFEGRTIILDGKVTGIELNASALKDNAAIDRVLNHEFAESANADGALNRLVERLTPKEKKEINDTITRLRYEDRARTTEEAARAIETLAEAWKGRGFFTRAVARVEAWASKLGFKLTRRAAEYIAARNLADINAGFRTAYNRFINVRGEAREGRAFVTPEENARFLELAKDPEANREELQKMVDEAAMPANQNAQDVFQTLLWFNDERIYPEKLGTSSLGVSRAVERGEDAWYFERISGRQPWIAADTSPVEAKILGQWLIKNIANVENIESIQDVPPPPYLPDNETSRNFRNGVVAYAKYFRSSADPVTYDDNGNVIPLEQRFQPATTDIRYARREVRESRREPEAIPTFTEGTPEAATLKEMATSMAKVDGASEAKGGKPETYKISEIASVWMEEGRDERALQDAIVEYTNLTPANAKRVASAIARQYDIQQSIATAFLETQTGLSVEALPEGVTLPKEVDPDRPRLVMQRLFEVFMGVKVPPKKITGSEKAFLRSQILLKIAANRAAKNAQKATADAVVETIKSMGLYGGVRPKQVAALTKRAAKVIWTSEKSVEVFNDYAAKVVANANYDADLREAKDAQKRAKQLSKQKNVAMSPQRQVLDNISRVAVNRIDDPRMFADVVNYYMRAFKSAVSPDYVVMPDSELTSYLSQMESEATTNQTEIDRVANERLAAKYGVSVDEANKLVEADNIIAELKKIEKREEMENLLTEKAIETQLGLSGYDTSLLRADQKPLVEALLKVDPSKLDAKEKQKLIRIANNVIYNDQTNGAQVFVAIANGQQNARQAAQDSAMVKKNRAWIDILPTLGSKTAEKTFRNWALELQSVADTFRNIFGKESMAKMFRLMGLYDLDRGFTDSNNVLDKIQEAMAEFYKKNVKKYGKAARDQDGILSEGIVGFLIQRVPAKGESESIAQRRDLIKQDIANRRDSQEADRIIMADRIEKILNEIDGNTIEEILNNLKQKYRPNYDSVMYLMNDLLPQYKEFLQRFDENFNDQANNYDNPYYLPIDFINAGPTLEITPESEALFYENVSLRPKQAANTIKRVDYTKLPLDKSNKPKEIQFNLRKGTYDSLSEQINAAYTSEAWQKIFSFMKTPEAQIALGGGANRDFMVERLNRLRISRMRRGSMNNGAMAKFADSLSTISRKLGVGIALGGVYQVFKQSPDQLISAIGTTGRPDLLSESITTIGKAKSILNKFSIGRRGDASAGYKYINQMEGAQNRLERAFTESRWSEVKENASKVADVWMVALKKTDFACAAAAWMTYYRADLDKKGIKFEGWDREAQLVDTDPTRQDAASYAENMTDIYQGSSDPTKMATFAQSGKSGWENLFKAIFVPFNSFAVQQRMRIYSDARDAFTQSGEAGKAGAAGLTATVGGMLAFHTVRRLMLPVLTGAGATALYALLGVDMDEPDEEKQKEEANKLWRQFQGEVIANMLVGGAPQFVEAQLIDAVNYSNYLVSLQLESDDVIDDKGEIMSFDKYQKERSPLWRYRSFDNAMTLGMLDIGLGQAEKAAMQTKMLATPEETEKYTPEEQRLLWFSALSEWMYLMRLNDADFARMVTKARKDMIAAVEDREKRIRAIREGR